MKTYVEQMENLERLNKEIEGMADLVEIETQIKENKDKIYLLKIENTKLLIKYSNMKEAYYKYHKA